MQYLHYLSHYLADCDKMIIGDSHHQWAFVGGPTTSPTNPRWQTVAKKCTLYAAANSFVCDMHDLYARSGFYCESDSPWTWVSCEKRSLRYRNSYFLLLKQFAFVLTYTHVISCFTFDLSLTWTFFQCVHSNIPIRLYGQCDADTILYAITKD